MLPIRIMIPMTIAALIGLVVLLGVNLQRELRFLSTDNSDNMTWTFLQAESEVANLGKLLVEQQIADVPESDLVRLRTDIAISRINLVTQGRFPRLMGGSPESVQIFSLLRSYRAELETVLDTNPILGQSEVNALRSSVAKIQPLVRRISVLGNAQATKIEEAQRENFAKSLALAGGIALSVLLGMSVLLIVLGRLLERAGERDIELRATTERLSSTVEAALDGIVVADSDWRIVEYNHAAREVFGWRRDEVIGAPVEETLIPVTAPIEPENYADFQTPVSVKFIVDKGRREILAMRKSGEKFPMEISIAETGQPGSRLYISYLRDISKRKTTESELIEARDSAQKADKAKSQFLSVMSHEMRTPLNGLLGVLDLLRTTRLTKRQEHHLDVAVASGELLLEHVNEALDVTRIETGAISITEQRFSVMDTLNRVVDVLEPLAREKSLTLKLEGDQDPESLYLGDGGRISQIVTNLVGNAIKFTDQGGIKVKIKGSHSTTHSLIKISVEDTGRGVPAEYHDKIFEPSFVLNPAEGRQSRSDGLGLSISRRIARLMGGELALSSPDEIGSEFILTIPLKRATTENSERAVSVDDDRHSGQNLAAKILIAEDNAVNRLILREMLTAMGHKVVEARNGVECIEIASSEKFDLIIMDISMPELDGIDATRQLKSQEGPNASTFILGLTAHGADEYKRRSEDAGMDAFETKPIRLSALSTFLKSFGKNDTHPVVEEETSADQRLDTNVASELLNLIGKERFLEAVETCLRDIKTTMDRLLDAEKSVDPDELKELVHMLRGGAHMVGLRGMVGSLDRIGEVHKSQNAPALLELVEEIQTAVADDRRAVTSYLAGL